MGEEAEKAATILAKIKKDQWKAMSETILELKELPGLGDMYTSLEDSLKLEMEKLFSPLKNEINDLITTAMEPFMPFVKQALNEAVTYLTRGMDFLTALLTGKLDTWMTKETTTLQKEIDKWPDEWKKIHTNVQKFIYEMEKSWARIGKTWSDFWRGLGYK